MERELKSQTKATVNILKCCSPVLRGNFSLVIDLGKRLIKRGTISFISE